MTTILKEVARSTSSYTVYKDIVEIYGTGSDSYAFKDCTWSLKNVYFEDGSLLERIDMYSFYKCCYLRSIELEKCTKLVSIGDRAFYDCEKLAQLNLPSALEIIGAYAFTGCRGLLTLNIPASVTSIGKGAFYNNDKKLENVVINGKVAVIPESCFQYDFFLVSVTLPDSVIEIEKDAFCFCKRLQSIVLPKSLKKIYYGAFNTCEEMKSCTIQEGLEYIEDYVFNDCENLTEIYLPSTLLNISYDVFQYCVNLAKVTVAPNMKIKSFGRSTFYKTNITEITIPATVTYIHPKTFNYANNLTKFIVETGNACFTTIDGVIFNIDKTKLMFYPSKKGKDYTVPENTQYIESNAFAFTNITNIVFPSTLKRIEEEAFICCNNLENLDLKEAAQNYGIERRAFFRCALLKELHISKSVHNIYEEAFYGCESLTAVNIDEGLYSIENEVFAHCYSLTHISLPNSVKYIKYRLFEYCWSLNSFEYGTGLTEFTSNMFESTGFTKFVIPEGITKIGDFCFQNCTKLEEIVLPASCVTLGASIFQGCNSDIKITFAEGSKFKIVLQYLIVNVEETIAYQYLLPSVLNLTLPSSIKEIKDSAFKDYESLENITFSDDSPQLEIIGRSAFENCKKLAIFDVCPKLREIESDAFKRSGIKSLDFCPNINSIPSWCFYECYELVSIPDLPNLTYIGSWNSFSSCTKLKTIGKLDKLTSIGEDSFEFCEKLESFPFCENLKSIGKEAFRRCESISEFTFGEKINSINNNVFESCHGLKKITFLASYGGSLSIGNNAFLNCWSLNQIVVDPNVNLTSIGSNAFKSTGVKLLYFPRSLSTIGEGAFYNCSVATIESDEEGKLTSIGPHCFENCTYLTQATLPGSITDIGNLAFNNTGLTSFTVPKSVRTFGDRVFENCTKLETFTIPDGSQLENVGYKIFSKCSSLREIKTMSSNYTIHEDGLFNKEKSRMIVFPPASQRKNFNMPRETIYICPSAFYSCNNLVTVTFQPNSIQQVDFSAFDSCLNLVKLNIPSSLTNIGTNAFYNCPKLACGQYIENPTPELFEKLTKVGGMSVYAASPCPVSASAVVKRPMIKIVYILI